MTAERHLRPVNGGHTQRARGAALEVVSNLERAVVGALLHDPAQAREVLELVGPADFHDPNMRAVLRCVTGLYEGGFDVTLHAVADELDRAELLESVGGAFALAQVFDEVSGTAGLLEHARRVRRLSLEREERQLHDRAAQGDRDESIRSRLAEVGAEIDALEAGGLDLPASSFTGERLEALRARPQLVSPLAELFDPMPSLHLLQGRPKGGKTTLGLALAQAWACGVAPWPGADALPGSRALVLSGEQPAGRIDSTLRRLDVLSKGRIDRNRWTERLLLVARDPDLPVSAERLLTLDDDGIARLRQGLARARREGDPVGLLLLDSLSRLKPAELDENSNDEMSTWLAGLQRLAEAEGAYVVLVHHVGHAERDQAHTAGRGASAIAAVAQAAWLLTDTPGEPRHRTLRVRGNALLTRDLVLEVAPETAEPGEILYFRPGDPLDRIRPEELLPQAEAINTSRLAELLAELDDREKPSGADKRHASQLRQRWAEAGKVQAFDGPRGSKMLRLVGV